jgi:UDP-N-acetylmuramate dehydrogenase
MINIKKNIPLAPLTTFKIGGPAKFFCEPKNEKEILEALNFAKENNLEVFVLGGGSNILVSDQGFDGLVIRMLNTFYSLHDTSIECSAGLLLSEVVKLASQNSLTGLEWAAGIPGTVGGAIRGNAGIPSGCMADNVESVKVLEIQNAKIEIVFSRKTKT